MSFYIALRNWVDALLARPGLYASIPIILPPGILILLTMPFLRGDDGSWMMVGAATMLWFSFIFWRGIRLGRAEAFKRDRPADILSGKQNG